MAIPYSLALVLLVPLVSAPVVYYLGKQMGKKVGWVATLPLILTLLLIFSLAADVKDGGTYSESYSWAPDAGLTFGLLADGLSYWMLITINVLCLMICVYSTTYMEHRFHEEEHHTGVPTVVIGVAARHIHSHGGIIHRDDYDNAVKLLTAVIARLDADTVSGLTA